MRLTRTGLGKAVTDRTRMSGAVSGRTILRDLPNNTRDCVLPSLKFAADMLGRSPRILLDRVVIARKRCREPGDGEAFETG